MSWVKMASITVKFFGLWQLVLGINSINIEAENADEALLKLDNEFSAQFKQAVIKRGLKIQGPLKDNSVVLLNGVSLSNLKNAKMKNGDILYIFPPIAGG